MKHTLNWTKKILSLYLDTNGTRQIDGEYVLLLFFIFFLIKIYFIMIIWRWGRCHQGTCGMCLFSSKKKQPSHLNDEWNLIIHKLHPRGNWTSNFWEWVVFFNRFLKIWSFSCKIEKIGVGLFQKTLKNTEKSFLSNGFYRM